jgi:signal transduction histidine kinase
MTQHDPGGENKTPSLSAEAWRERFSEAFGDSLDLYTELFALSPAPVMVDDWSRIRDLVEDLKQNPDALVERQILDDPELGREIWSRIGHIAANPAMLAVTRISAADLFDHFMDIYEPSIAPSIAHVLQSFADGVFDVAWPEMTVAAADGTPLTVRGRILVPPAHRDTWRIVLSTFEDMTEVRRREQELLDATLRAEQAAEAKSEFLSTMSHEFRTPLNAIMGFAQVLQAETFGPVGDRRYVRYAEDIIASGDHLLGLVEDILDLAQADAGKMVLNEETVSLREVTDQALRLVQDRAARAGLTIRARLPGDLPRLNIDPRRMRQLLLNLLSNAIKFTDPGGTIAITAGQRDDQTLTVCVEDTGRGMTPEEAALALEPFGQVHRTHHGQVEGWGLGLPIARHLAELHGGRLELESTPEKGTHVRVVLPPERVAAD